MEKTKLKQLVLTSFRGATHPVNIEFDPEKKVTLIFGENGTGKSSIVDAFSFLCEGKLGSLEERSGAENKHITSISSKAAQLHVKLTTAKGVWEAALNGSAIEVKPPQGCPSVRILRRSKILSLIDRQPKERFDALREYIEVPGIDKSEKGLREVVKDTNDELTLQAKAFTQAQAALGGLWEKEGKLGGSADAWAKAEKAKDLTLLKNDVTEIDKILASIRDVEKTKLTWDKAVGDIAPAEAAYKKAVAAQTVEEQKVIGQNASLLTLLKEAKDYVAATKSLEACPVCQKPVEADKLAAELQGRIAAMSSLATATNTTTTQKKLFDAAKSKLDAAQEAYLIALADLGGLIKASKLAAVTSAAIPTATTDTLTNDALSIADKLAVAPNLLAVLPCLKTALDKQKTEAQTSTAQQNAITLQLDTMLKKDSEQKGTGGLLVKLKRALEIVETARKKFVTSVLVEISGETERLYSTLHPNEEIGKIRLALDPNKIGSLHLRGTFHTEKDITPQSLFSESHLDTLGFCVFLALAKKYKDDDTIVILDDVMTSVDRDHLDRFIELLHDEEKHFSQFIVTTHYQPWRDRYRNHRAPGGKVHFIELRPWSLGTGIRVQGMKLCLDELRQVMAASPFDRQAAASKSGIFMENMLEFLARVYACKLPLTSQSGYTLRELTDCFPSKLLKLLKVERITVVKDAAGNETSSTATIQLEPIILQIKGLATVRNQVGCHYNFEAANVSDKEVEELGKTTVIFGEALICAEYGDLPSRNRSGTYHESRSGKVRLYPFDQPN